MGHRVRRNKLIFFFQTLGALYKLHVNGADLS
jgi:hypothetical protein